MKKIFFAAIALAALALAGCASSNTLYDLKNQNLSAPAQNTVRVCNTLTWIYYTSSDYNDMNELLKEIGITREELQTLKFNGSYEKPFGRQFSMSADNDDDEKQIYAKAKKQARKIASLILKKIPEENSSESESEQE